MTTSIYQDIASRTDGDIYIGVVGPVRTGKSTFIKKQIFVNYSFLIKKDLRPVIGRKPLLSLTTCYNIHDILTIISVFSYVFPITEEIPVIIY